MAAFNVSSRQCPVCKEIAVERYCNTLTFKQPSHHCKKCDSQLTTAHTKDTLWAVPVSTLALLAMIAMLLYLRESQTITGALRSALMGGAGALALSVSLQSYLRGIVLRPWSGND